MGLGSIPRCRVPPANALLCLILTSDFSLKQVAYEAGFKSPSNFSLAFKRNVGLTPSAFRSVVR
jgi:AraC-like DNA-binding protein